MTKHTKIFSMLRNSVVFYPSTPMTTWSIASLSIFNDPNRFESLLITLYSLVIFFLLSNSSLAQSSHDILRFNNQSSIDWIRFRRNTAANCFCNNLPPNPYIIVKNNNLNGNETVFLPKPTNISVILIQYYPSTVRINWAYDRSALKNCRLQAFQIIYHPTKSRYRIIHEVSPFTSNLTLERLQSGTEYSVFINALAETGHTNQSTLVQFISPDNETRRSHRKHINQPIHKIPGEDGDDSLVREDEVAIVVIVIIAWIGCIFIFFNKWGKIRMLEPYQPQYKESFHNSIHSLHPKPSRMNTCTSVPPNMISIESHGSLIMPDRDLLFHHNRMTESGQLYQCASGTTYHHPAYRSRLNSVFVGDPYHRNLLYPEPNMPRRVKSAEDLKSIVVQVNNNVPSTSTSIL